VPRQRQNWHGRNRHDVRDDTARCNEHAGRPVCNLREHRRQLPTTKGGPTQNSNHGGRKPNQSPWGVDDKNSRYHNVKTSLEQCTQHTKGKIHVPRPQELLPVGAARAIRIYAHLDWNVPAWTIKQYDLSTKVVRGYVYLEMRRAVWGLPQVGILANKLLRKHLAPKGYYECKQTPGL